MKHHLCQALLVVALCCQPALPETEVDELSKKFFNMDLAELLEVTVTSSSKKQERQIDAASAIFTLTNEDIVRSGATSIPEVLRLVPGLDVGRLGSSTWAISARGLRDLFSNKLLVLMDGRNLYNPLFAGTYWDVQDYILEDIERIEVIRGPGASLWGANAVNGVINIITKDAKDTNDSIVSIGGGNEDLGQLLMRTGFHMGNTGAGRVYAKFNARDSLQRRDNASQNNDEWRTGRAGFRSDWINEDSDVTFQGDAYAGLHGERLTLSTLVPPEIRDEYGLQRVHGANLLGRYRTTDSEEVKTNVQLYVDHIQRDGLDLDQTRTTVDLELEHRRQLAASTDLLLGAGYRVYDLKNEGDFVTNFTSPDTLDIWNTYIHLEQGFLDGKLVGTVGTKLSLNDYSGTEVQPSARLRYSIDSTTAIWTAFSRAVRTPSITERDANINVAAQPGGPGGVPVVIRLVGNDDFTSEDLLSYEAGVRSQLTDWSFSTLSLFWNEYDNLTTSGGRAPFLDPNLEVPAFVVPILLANQGAGSIYGGELTITGQLYSWWRTDASYSYQRIVLTWPEDDESLEARSGESPEHKFVIRSLMSIGDSWQVDTTLRYQDAVPSRSISSYLQGDVRVGYQITEGISFSILGTNLFGSSHMEATASDRPTLETEVERSVFGALRFQL